MSGIRLWFTDCSNFHFLDFSGSGTGALHICPGKQGSRVVTLPVCMQKKGEYHGHILTITCELLTSLDERSEAKLVQLEFS